ncbi:PfkB family carbohydrate kinase [Massiliimalia massiliensis]|uniref:PfkB family carbohydrate kinase n=1 Tax=Massiliimalia massiliensis TaxID=1852384 RepID=UPI00117BBAA5|nr:PfkB family carbohydrate kinase [Massiliimalia massiliensis]
MVENLEDSMVMQVKEVRNTVGRKGLNVSRVAELLGEQATALGFVGGYNGSYVLDLLEKQGMKHQFTRIAAETRSCINIQTAY